LPSVSVGLSREHDWAAGTLSLSVTGMTGILRDLAREIGRALPARNLLIVNGHGGNRGILEALGRELRGDFGLNLGALHLGAMMSPNLDAAAPEIHAGMDETSVMLALAPDLVRRERIQELKAPPDGAAARVLILDPAASWPWSSGDKRIGEAGVIGDARPASVGHGNAIVSRVVDAAGTVLKQLLANQPSS
jgi:creatinine amidohydrolase/Fe(II)-dependent formamide hydrolase-like protein